MSQQPSIAAFREGQPWLDAVLHQLERNRHLLAHLVEEHLPGVRYTPPEGTFLAWLDLRRLPPRSPSLAEYLQARAGVTVVDGMECDPAGKGFIRLNFATTPAILADVVARLGAALRG